MNNFKLHRILLLLSLALFSAACSTIKTHSDFSPDIDFKHYKTFSWISENPLIHASGSTRISPLNAQRIHSAIETKLVAMGYHQVALKDSPDFTLSYTVGTREKVDVYSYPSYYQRNPWNWPYYHDDLSVHRYTEGTLAIDIFDHATGKPAWHGAAKKRITEYDLDNTAESIHDVVAAILNKFPKPVSTK